MIEVFIAYASGNAYHGEIIRKAAASASSATRKLLTWSERDTSGFPISDSVESWIARSDAFIGDISVVNDNVTFEVGFAIGLGKPVRLIRSSHVDFTPVKNIALLDTLGHDEYNLEPVLSNIFRKKDEEPRWHDIPKNREQPVFILQPPNPSESSLRLTSAVKKTARLKFRSANPWEISRLSASEAYEQTASSYGVIAFWLNPITEEAIRNNQRAALIFGIARGKSIPAILLAPYNLQLPLDIQDKATRWRNFGDLDKTIVQFRDQVADLQNEFVEPRPIDEGILAYISCGDPTAENEATGLSEYFLETEGYQRALNGEANILVGRKGSGKTAVFLQVRDRTRSQKENIIIDLIPDGHQLVKMKEFILEQLTLGSRKEIISAFWEYVIWLEIAHKLLEKDRDRAYRDPALLIQFQRLEKLFEARVDTGSGDFSERLRILSEQIIKRFTLEHPDHGAQRLDSSDVLTIVYGEELTQLRAAVSEYLHLKGFVFVLLDNLDRFWTPGGFDQTDAVIIIGLIESMQDITRRLKRGKLDFRWAIFVRSDVYEFLIRGMADYGKHSVQSLEWSDRDLLKIMFERRIESGVLRRGLTWNDLWTQISDQNVDGKSTLDFLVDASLMRPRYLIRLFETARRRAITFGRSKIEISDYHSALRELGWQVLEDLDREISDLVENSTDLLFEILQAASGLTPAKLKYLAGKRLATPSAAEKLIDVMIWNGSLGVLDGNAPKYIFDCGYKRQYLGALINSNDDVKLFLHPTLLSALQWESEPA